MLTPNKTARGVRTTRRSEPARASRRFRVPAVEAMEERRLMSADVDMLTMQQAFGADARKVSSNLLDAYFLAQAPVATFGVVGPLTEAYVLQGRAQALAAEARDNSAVPTLLVDEEGRVGAVFTATDPDGLAASLAALGVQVSASLPAYHRVEGFVPLSALPAVSGLGPRGLLGVTEVVLPKTYKGTVQNQADNVLEGDRVRTSVAGYTGAGVKIGVLSDSYDKASGATRASASISSGNLPNNVQVLQEYAPNSATLSSAVGDEGRAMLELIYDVAPDAGLGFASAFNGEAQFAANIRNLAAAGYGVIVDDVGYFDEPFFQDGIVSQAVNDVAANNNVTYFSSAGNAGNLSYDSAAPAAYGSNSPNFVTQTIPILSSSPSSYYDWDPSSSTTTTMLPVTIPRGASIGPNLQWDQPFYTTNGVRTDLDVYLISQNTSTGTYTVRAGGNTDNTQNQTPWEYFTYTNTLSTATNAVTRFFLVIQNYNNGPTVGRVKFIDEAGNTSVSYGSLFTYSSTIFGHPGATGAVAVGAAPFYAQNTPESFSSIGPVTILFNPDGTRKAAPEVRAKPDVMSIDAGDTSFFIPGNDLDGNGYNNFTGTSAAAPNAAAVAALYRQANPGATPAQVVSRLKATADPNVGTGDPNVIGAGMISAYRAIYGGPVAAATPVNDGFESGTLGSAWQTYKQGAGSIQVVAASNTTGVQTTPANYTNAPANGTYSLILGANIGYGTSGFGLPVLNEAILHVNAANKAGLVLSFNEKKSQGETDNAMPATFSGHGNYDGVALSVDGTNWYRIVSLTGANSTTAYQNQTFNLSAIAAGLGLTLTGDTQVKFQQYNSAAFAYNIQGLAFDDVRVTAQSKVASTSVDLGSAQRSMIRSLTVNFAGNIATVPASAFALTRTSDNVSIPVAVSSVARPNGNSTVVTLTFSGPNLDGPSLGDGRYTLSINGNALLDDSGRAVDADGDGVDGGTGTVSFFRFFGDGDGDGVVDATDYLLFLNAYRSGNATGTNSIYDVDGSGTFTSGDLAAFLQRFNKRRLP